MKKIFLIGLICLPTMFFTNITYGQDIITFRNGDEIKSKVLEVTSDQVKYKKWENMEGPTYSSMKSEVFMIKYQNGTKELLKSQEVINTNNVTASNEEIKKNEAVEKLEKYVRNKITGQVVKFESFKKTNGIMNNVFGQMIYTINCDIDIRFINDGWKKGNGLEGYWSNFYVYPSEPNLSASGEQFMYTTKLYQKGTSLTLGCVAEMSSTDNGFEVKTLSIKTVTNHGIVAISNIKPEPSNIVTGYKGENKVGENGKMIKEGKGKETFQDGATYEGEWKNDKFNGYGTLIYADGSKYIGYWKENKKDSIGFQTYVLDADQSQYIKNESFSGIFKDGVPFNGVMSFYNYRGQKKECIIKNGVYGKFKVVRE